MADVSRDRTNGLRTASFHAPKSDPPQPRFAEVTTPVVATSKASEAHLAVDSPLESDPPETLSFDRSSVPNTQASEERVFQDSQATLKWGDQFNKEALKLRAKMDRMQRDWDRMVLEQAPKAPR